MRVCVRRGIGRWRRRIRVGRIGGYIPGLVDRPAWLILVKIARICGMRILHDGSICLLGVDGTGPRITNRVHDGVEVVRFDHYRTGAQLRHRFSWRILEG